jgi:hypothetical protein
MKKGDDEDDAPTYVMEETNQSLSKEEYDALVAGKDDNKDEPAADEAGENKDNDAKSRSKEKIAEVGANAKKRKAAKIIGDDQDESEKEGEADVKKPDAKSAKKPKKKAKAVKLTFGEDEG